MFCRCAAGRQFIVAMLLSCCALESAAGQDAPTVFRSGDEVVIRFADLAAWRKSNRSLKVTIRIDGDAGRRDLAMDLADRAVPESLVVDLAGYGSCSAVEYEVAGDDGRMLASSRVAPVPEISVVVGSSSRVGPTAAVEIGTALDPTQAPRITLPDVATLPVQVPAKAPRSVASRDISYPVIAEVDLPILASINAVIVSRQSAAPDDTSKCSVYFSYRKGIFDQAESRLKEYRKMLVEVPLDRRWLESSGDDVIALPADGFAIHTTDELERFGERWNAPQGYNMLGGSSTGLFQGGQTVEVDDAGRIYISNVPDGAGLIRFNPHIGRFEQPPVNFYAEMKKFLPTDAPWRRSWDADLAQVVCTRGRVYVVFDRHYRVTTPNGKFETCSGVVSVSQEHWDDAEAFRRDIRFHAGCWPQAVPSLYADDVAEGKPRRAGPPTATLHGIAFGSWRLDLDDQGNSVRLTQVKSLSDTVAVDGTPLEPTRVATINGLPRQRAINVGSAGRPFLTFGYGEFTITRAALGLTLPGAPPERLVDANGVYRTTYPDAPGGKITVRFDIAAKLRDEHRRYGLPSSSLSGVSQGPNYALIATPAEADCAIGVCEYGYYFSKVDFSRRAAERKVFRSYLPASGGEAVAGLPVHLGLGPYNTAWIEHDDALWLYTAGYTGLGRLKYAEQGRTLDGFEQDVIHRRLNPKPVDGVARDSVKDFLHVVPALGGRLINIGRGRPGRGGGAYSAGLELFDPRALGASKTAVKMNRCYGLYTPVSRVVVSAATGGVRQEVFAASGSIRPEYVADLADPAERPANQGPKIFAYSCDIDGDLRDLYGFALPELPGGDAASNIAISPCRRFLIVLQFGGALHAYEISTGRFVDGARLQTADGVPLRPLSFSRPSSTICSTPDGRLFCYAAPDADRARAAQFYELRVAADGRLTVAPHLEIAWDKSEKLRDYNDVVHCFLPDLVRRDGSYDLVLGGNLDNGGAPMVRVVDDFVPPSN